MLFRRLAWTFPIEPDSSTIMTMSVLIKAALAAEPNTPASAAIAIVATSLFILMSFSSVSFFERIRQITQSVANLEARLEPKYFLFKSTSFQKSRATDRLVCTKYPTVSRTNFGSA